MEQFFDVFTKLVFKYHKSIVLEKIRRKTTTFLTENVEVDNESYKFLNNCFITVYLNRYII